MGSDLDPSQNMSEPNTSKATTLATPDIDNIDDPAQLFNIGHHHRPSSLTDIQGTCSHHDLHMPDPQTLGKPRQPRQPRSERRITWREQEHEKNPTVVPEDLKKDSLARRTSAEPKDYASWFEGSPQDLDERREMRMENEMWLKRVKKWRREEERSRSRSRSRDRNSVAHTRVPNSGTEEWIERIKRWFA